jgi:hypothetical protein
MVERSRMGDASRVHVKGNGWGPDSAKQPAVMQHRLKGLPHDCVSGSNQTAACHTEHLTENLLFRFAFKRQYHFCIRDSLSECVSALNLANVLHNRACNMLNRVSATILKHVNSKNSMVFHNRVTSKLRKICVSHPVAAVQWSTSRGAQPQHTGHSLVLVYQ